MKERIKNWVKNNWWIWILVISFISIFLIINRKSIINMTISDRISLVTAIAVFAYTATTFWYAFETRIMVKEIIKQNELSLMPVIIIYSHYKNLYIKNIGKGTALNISIKSMAPVNNNTKAPPKWEEIPLLLPGGKEILKVKSDSDGMFTSVTLNSLFATTNCNIEVEYTSINGTTYRSLITAGKDGIKIRSIKRVKV